VSRFAANDPAHCRIVAQAFGVIHVFVAREAPEHGLPQQSDQRMPAVLASARVGKRFTRKFAQTERIIEFAIGKQSSIGCNDGSAKLQHHAAVEIKPENAVIRFTRGVRHEIAYL